MITGISAVTLATHDMARAVAFYHLLDLPVIHGGPEAGFTSLRAGDNYLKLILQPPERHWSWWGRLILYCDDVDALHARLVAAGLHPEAAPRDAPWGERYFHIADPDGHEVSLARPLARRAAPGASRPRRRGD